MIRVAIVGAGIMGTNHARVLKTNKDCDVVAVIDPDSKAGNALAKAIGVPWLPRLETGLTRIDAAVVAAPTERHTELVCRLLAAGINVLVEKPVCTSLEELRQIEFAASRSKGLVMVGHVERFNPAVLELGRLIGSIVHLDFRRIGPFSPRIRGDVILDLMIHDIDLALLLTGEFPTYIAAAGRAVKSPFHDTAHAIVAFPSGVTATFAASRVAQRKVREVDITQRDDFISVDLLRQDVTIHRVEHSEYVSREGATYRQIGHVDIPFLTYRGEPLALQLERFISGIRDGKHPTPSLTDGGRALQVALAVRERLTASQPAVERHLT